MTYEVDGEQYVAIATGGNQSVAALGDAVWSFSMNGQPRPLWPPRRRQLFLGPPAQSPKRRHGEDRRQKCGV